MKASARNASAQHSARAVAERMDIELVRQSHVEAALRLRLGQVLEVLGRGACFELGFSSLSAYALERCERRVRWALAARCLARRLEELPVLRSAVAQGQLSWSKAELVAPVARREEARWLAAAQRLTVRELRALLSESKQPPGSESEEAAQQAGGELCRLTCTVDHEEAWLFEATRALLDQLGTHGSDAQVEALLAEAQSTLINALPPGSIDVDAIAGNEEAQKKWLEQLTRWREEAEARCEVRIPRVNSPPSELQSSASEVQEDLDRASATRHDTEPRGSGGSNVYNLSGSVSRAAISGCSSLAGLTARELDRLAQSLARSMAQHELAFCRLVREFMRHDGWRLLGGVDEHGRFHARYATETQYARERLGISRSSLLARRALAARLDGSREVGAERAGRLPQIAEALGAGKIGIEAALQLVRVATPATDSAWALHAQRRTIKHLKEDVAAALVAQRISGEADCPPPSNIEIEAFHELERAAASGRIWQPKPAEAAAPSPGRSDEIRAPHSPAQAPQQGSPARPNSDTSAQSPAIGNGESAPREAWRVTLDSLDQWLNENVRMSAAPSGANRRSVHTSAAPSTSKHRGRVVLRLHVSREVRDFWRGLEKQARRWLPNGMSWLRFCCLSLWKAWHHLLAPNVAYGHIYVRDRHRCSSPVCTRRDVTPHHLKFRSQGGSDEDDNIGAVCVWCHLCGIHGGRIRAVGSAREIRWELGRRGQTCLVVTGRERQAA